MHLIILFIYTLVRINTCIIYENMLVCNLSTVEALKNTDTRRIIRKTQHAG